jgi:hypothetical protein
MEIKPKEFFAIEEEDGRYRFVSLYKECRGTWFEDMCLAEEQGREHTRIVKMIHNLA